MIENKPYVLIGQEKNQYRRDMRLIDKIIIHCSDSDRIVHDDISIIRKWHKSRGFQEVGYHFFITSKGEIQEGRPLGMIGAHCATQNITALGICLSGSKKFYDAQFIACRNLCLILLSRFNIKKDMVLPHSYFNAHKTCPNFAIDKIWQTETI